MGGGVPYIYICVCVYVCIYTYIHASIHPYTVAYRISTCDIYIYTYLPMYFFISICINLSFLAYPAFLLYGQVQDEKEERELRGIKARKFWHLSAEQAQSV